MHRVSSCHMFDFNHYLQVSTMVLTCILSTLQTIDWYWLSIKSDHVLGTSNYLVIRTSPIDLVIFKAPIYGPILVQKIHWEPLKEAGKIPSVAEFGTFHLWSRKSMDSELVLWATVVKWELPAGSHQLWCTNTFSPRLTRRAGQGWLGRFRDGLW